LKKRTVLVVNGGLLFWFFLDMTGLRIADRLIVSSAYKEDGVFFILYVMVFGLFLFRETIGRYVLLGWLFMWFATQFASHWAFTIFGPAEEKMAYFSDTMKLFFSNDVYIPDLYHVVLHFLIVLTFVTLMLYKPGTKDIKV
jgi:hypothetical protein